MEITFKDKASKNLFKNNKVNKSNTLEEEPSFNKLDIDDFYQEFIDIQDKSNNNTVNIKNEEKKEIEISKEDDSTYKDLITIKSTMNRIESKQNVILEILDNIPLPRVNEIEVKKIEDNELDFLNIVFNLFNDKLILISIKSKNQNIKELLYLLNLISDYLLSNSFYIFTLEKSPITKALKSLSYLGMDKRINKSSIETENLLIKISKISKMKIFHQNYYYAELMLDKGLLLQSIILLNESISIYIIETIKNFSKDINKYTSLYGEENKPKLYSQAKDFFITLFPCKKGKNINANIIAIFPNHKYPKEMDKLIADKFKRIDKTLQNKGDTGLFEKYSYIIDRVRRIRNNLAHGNMELDFRDLKKEMIMIMKDFNYLTIDKNIFKYKIKGE